MCVGVLRVCVRVCVLCLCVFFPKPSEVDFPRVAHRVHPRIPPAVLMECVLSGSLIVRLAISKVAGLRSGVMSNLQTHGPPGRGAVGVGNALQKLEVSYAPGRGMANSLKFGRNG